MIEEPTHVYRVVFSACRATSAPSVDAWAAEAAEEHDDKPSDVPTVPDVGDEVEAGREEDAPGDVDESIFGDASTDNEGS